MSRDIKFRAWEKKQRRLFKVLKLELGARWIVTDQGDNDWLKSVGDDVELMQYTGLKDMEGRDIYEGDVVQYYSNDPRGNLGKNRVRVIEWRMSTHHVGWNIGVGRNHNRGDVLKYTKVIGNRFEHPELLKEGTQ